jgi:hypothetical protein
MLLHDIEVIAVGVQCSNPNFSTLGAIVAMIIISTDDSNILFTQNLGDPTSQSCFTRAAIANDAENDRTIIH